MVENPLSNISKFITNGKGYFEHIQFEHLQFQSKDCSQKAH